MNSKPTTSGWQMAGFMVSGILLGLFLGQIFLALSESMISEDRRSLISWSAYIYPAFWLGLAGFIASWSSGNTMRKIRIGLYWISLWHLIVLVFISGGAVTGSLLFLVIGSLAGMDYGITEMIKSGARNGGFYLLIWSPGIALVLCSMKAYKKHG